ncbi:hypothetical protein C8J57DRAFT_1241754 [Mycena rebaudengoi]|nr:hypothetical protein C8J57DRAFT_1241754 [Mycena rebaudengoi]
MSSGNRETQCFAINLGRQQTGTAATKDAGVGWNLNQTSPAEVVERGEKHRALTKAECAPPNIVESPAWLKNVRGASLDSKIPAKDAGVGTILELEPDISGGGGGASASGTELRPRLNVLLQTLWSLQFGSKLLVELQQLDSKIAAEDAGVGTILELDPDISSGRGGASASGTKLRPRLNVPRCWLKSHGGASLDSKIAAEDAGVGTILELDPDIFGSGGGASVRTTELRPRLKVLCQTLWMLKYWLNVP